MKTKSIVTLAVLALSGSSIAQQTITCSSTRNGSHFCPANTKNGVMLLQEHSNGVCEHGSTWTYTKRGITVKGGCSADFQVGGQRSADTNNSNSYSNNSYGKDASDANRNNANGNNANDANRNGQYRSDGNSQNSANRDGYPNANQNGQGNVNGDARRDRRDDGDADRRQATIVLPAGTQLDVRIEQRVSASEVTRGDLIAATLVNGLSVNGQLVAPVGTPVQAKVASAQGAPLDVRLDSITINGQRYVLTSNSIHSARDSQSAQNESNSTGGEEIGSLLGSLTGGAQLPRGSVYRFRLTSAATATPNR